ncbi:Os02g0240633 [Oryza sativa Japonica Group]|jgi:hypothetical protein|uniref:Os02g0240633 protein n=1 Tax=Oryza sativa subsp. japonica TaxID=39947 RepID=A0A0P0VGY8_ORYSJ|nr:Os02g0240633 [Oryza sativa Japonica Group]
MDALGQGAGAVGPPPRRSVGGAAGPVAGGGGAGARRRRSGGKESGRSTPAAHRMPLLSHRPLKRHSSPPVLAAVLSLPLAAAGVLGARKPQVAGGHPLRRRRRGMLPPPER